MIKEEITTTYITKDGHRFNKKEEAEKYEIEHSSKEDLYNTIKELEKKIEKLESDLLEEKSKKIDPNIFPSKPISPWVQPSPWAQPSPYEPTPNVYPKPWDYCPPVIYNKNTTYIGVKDGIYQILNEDEYNKLPEKDKKKYIGVPESQVTFNP